MTFSAAGSSIYDSMLTPVDAANATLQTACAMMVLAVLDLTLQMPLLLPPVGWVALVFTPILKFMPLLVNTTHNPINQ